MAMCAPLPARLISSASSATAATPGTAAMRRAIARSNGLVVGRAGDDVVGADALVELLRLRAGHDVREDRHERGQRDADHERGGRRGRARREAGRVVGAPASRARPRCGAAASRDRHEHRHEPAGERRDRAEQADRADGDQEQAGADAAGVAERAERRAAVAGQASAASPAISERRRGWLRAATDSRRLTAGATRPARAAGTSAATSVTPMPTMSAGRSVAGVSAIGTSGIVRPIALKSAIRPAPSAMPRPVPIERGDGADGEALGEHRGQRLAPAWRRGSAGARAPARAARP